MPRQLSAADGADRARRGELAFAVDRLQRPAIAAFVRARVPLAEVGRGRHGEVPVEAVRSVAVDAEADFAPRARHDLGVDVGPVDAVVRRRLVVLVDEADRHQEQAGAATQARLELAFEPELLDFRFATVVGRGDGVLPLPLGDHLRLVVELVLHADHGALHVDVRVLGRLGRVRVADLAVGTHRRRCRPAAEQPAQAVALRHRRRRLRLRRLRLPRRLGLLRRRLRWRRRRRRRCWRCRLRGHHRRGGEALCLCRLLRLRGLELLDLGLQRRVLLLQRLELLRQLGGGHGRGPLLRRRGVAGRLGLCGGGDDERTGDARGRESARQQRGFEVHGHGVVLLEAIGWGAGRAHGAL